MPVLCLAVRLAPLLLVLLTARVHVHATSKASSCASLEAEGNWCVDDTDEPIVALQLDLGVKNRGHKKKPIPAPPSQIEERSVPSDVAAEQRPSVSVKSDKAGEGVAETEVEAGAATSESPPLQDIYALLQDPRSGLLIFSLVVGVVLVCGALFMRIWGSLNIKAQAGTGTIQWKVDLYPRRATEPTAPAEFKDAQLVGTNASFAMSLDSILSCCGDADFFIHEKQGDVMHQVLLTGPPEGMGWAKVELLASGERNSLPSTILSCCPANGEPEMEDVMNSWHSLLVHEKRGAEDCNLVDDMITAQGTYAAEDQIFQKACAPYTSAEPPSRLEIHDGLGSTIGMLQPIHVGKYALLQHGKLTMEISLDSEKNRVRVSKDGAEVALATCWRQEGCPELVPQSCEEHMQVDTVPGTNSPDTALSLMCVLAILVFK